MQKGLKITTLALVRQLSGDKEKEKENEERKRAEENAPSTVEQLRLKEEELKELQKGRERQAKIVQGGNAGERENNITECLAKCSCPMRSSSSSSTLE